MLKNYRVKPGKYHGAHKQYSPGSTVQLTEEEAAGFLDKLELVQEPAQENEADMPKYDGIKAPGGGFEPLNATVEQVKEWIATDPGRLQAAVVLQSERDGKARKTVIEALEAYIEEKANVD